MAAVVQIAETNGPTGSSVETINPSNVNFGSVDAAELNPSANPITAMVDGHSFEKWLRLYVSDMAGSSAVDNLRVWISSLGGGWKTGEGMSTNARTSGYSGASYPAGGPVETNSATATQAMPESKPSGPNFGVGGALTGQIIAAPGYSDWLVLQLDVSDLTPAGAVNQKTITWQWDEQ
jgi:hypothetical protein